MGWRLPFIIGLVVGWRAGVTPRYSREKPSERAHERSPLAETFRDHGPLLLRLAALSVFNSVGFYLMFVYIVSWLQLVDGVTPARALGINTISMVLLLPLIVAMGWLGPTSDAGR